MIKDCLAKVSIAVFVLLNTFFRCSSNFNLTSKIIPRCFQELTWESLLLLKSKRGCDTLFTFLQNIISWACLIRSGLKFIFHWKAQSVIFFRSLFNSIADVFVLCPTRNTEVSSADSLAFDDKLSDKSLT